MIERFLPGLMMRGVKEVPWHRLDEAIPASLTMAVMPLTFSIANGLGMGIVSWVAIKLLTGRGRAVRRPLYALAVLWVVFAAFFDTR